MLLFTDINVEYLENNDGQCVALDETATA